MTSPSTCRSTTARWESAREFKDKARMMYFSNEVIDRFCATATPGQLAAAAAMLDDEQGVRERRKRDRLFRKAKFPQVKSFEGYDFSQVSFPEGYTAEDLMGLGFIDRAQDFVFYGQTGRGKTHLAIAIGVAAASSGKTVRFFTTAELVMALTMANSAGALDQFMRDLAKADLLILDDLGTEFISDFSVSELFRILNTRLLTKKKTIVSTNLSLQDIKRVYSERTLSRIIGDFTILKFCGNDIRFMKKG